MNTIRQGSKVCDFRVYIDAVPGKNHDNEFLAVLDYGAKVSQPIARACLPTWRCPTC